MIGLILVTIEAAAWVVFFTLVMRRERRHEDEREAWNSGRIPRLDLREAWRWDIRHRRAPQ